MAPYLSVVRQRVTAACSSASYCSPHEYLRWVLDRERGTAACTYVPACMHGYGTAARADQSHVITLTNGVDSLITAAVL